jgi:hypothetical protein
VNGTIAEILQIAVETKVLEGFVFASKSSEQSTLLDPEGIGCEYQAKEETT